MLFSFSCKKKEVFTEPEFLLKKWASSAKNLNYAEHSAIEAYPKSVQVFAESFKEYYPSDVRILKVEEPNEGAILRDHKGLMYNKRNVQFEFTQINRKSQTPAGEVRGDVDFVKYIDGDKKNKGWVMLNRTMIRLHN